MLGLVKVWLMIEPELALAPVTLPTMAPIVHVKVLAVLADKNKVVPVPLHIVFVEVFVILGVGYTVTVIVKGLPTQEPAVDVGVTIYCTEPENALLGLVSN